jgi:hypothetical protein
VNPDNYWAANIIEKTRVIAGMWIRVGRNVAVAAMMILLVSLSTDIFGVQVDVLSPSFAGAWGYKFAIAGFAVVALGGAVMWGSNVTETVIEWNSSSADYRITSTSLHPCSPQNSGASEFSPQVRTFLDHLFILDDNLANYGFKFLSNRSILINGTLLFRPKLRIRVHYVERWSWVTQPTKSISMTPIGNPQQLRDIVC